MTPDRAKAARDLLAFYAEAGVDAAVGEVANDWLSEAAASPRVTSSLAGEVARRSPQGEGGREGRQQPTPSPTLPRQGRGSAHEQAARPATHAIAAPPAPPEAAVMAAREAARSAATLDTLRDILDRFEGCALKTTASRLVFADGNPRGRLMFVGEAPGYEEDKQGLPFVGKSGRLLDLMLKSIGLDRDQAYIANIVPWRPPGNRTPTPVETQICLPFIKRQIELADPDILVTVGQPSTAALIGVQGITKNRGRWFAYHTGTREIRAMPMLHPAYLLRSPIAKRLAWRDLLAIKAALG
jgi:uracil-DNA glycosylase